MKEFICYDKKSVDDLLICKPLSYEKLSEIILDSKCKYSSAQSMKRTYVIEYKSDGTFINSRFFINSRSDDTFFKSNNETNKIIIEREINVGSGTFQIVEENGNGLINIQYNKIIPSENEKSPMNENNPFFPKLKNYSIGPFYIVDSYDETKELSKRRNITQLIYKGPNNQRLLTVYKNN